MNVAFQRSESRTGDDDRKDHECENVLRYVNSQYSVLARSLHTPVGSERSWAQHCENCLLIIIASHCLHRKYSTTENRFDFHTGSGATRLSYRV